MLPQSISKLFLFSEFSLSGVFSALDRVIRYVIQFWSCLLIACIVVYPVILSLQALVHKMAQVDDWTEAKINVQIVYTENL